MPGGFYRGSFALIMNQERFDSLSAQDREALMTVFGEPMSQMAGQVWDEIDAIGTEATLAAPGNSLSEADQNVTKIRWKVAQGPPRAPIRRALAPAARRPR